MICTSNGHHCPPAAGSEISPTPNLPCHRHGKLPTSTTTPINRWSSPHQATRQENPRPHTEHHTAVIAVTAKTQTPHIAGPCQLPADTRTPGSGVYPNHSTEQRRTGKNRRHPVPSDSASAVENSPSRHQTCTAHDTWPNTPPQSTVPEA